MSKITKLTIVKQQETSAYFVGKEYGGLVLHKIYDDSVEFEDAYCSIYKGVTEYGQLVFEAINAPIEVVYSADT